MLWEALTGDRLFDGKNDIEIFKKIRACKIPSIQTRRKDVPAALAAVLEVALSADPANRYATAEEFAHALDQVIKQAVGINTATALAAAVMEARAQLKQSGETDDQSTTEHRAALELELDLELDGSLIDPELDPLEPATPIAIARPKLVRRPSPSKDKP